jgi:hypothetical protein
MAALRGTGEGVRASPARYGKPDVRFVGFMALAPAMLMLRSVDTL